MAENVEELKVKVFEKYQEFPPETRMLIIDEMQPDDRCRFTGCSKLSNKEGKASKNYLHGLSIFSGSDKTTTTVFHSSYDPYAYEPLGGYFMKFHKTSSGWYEGGNTDPMLAAMHKLHLRHIEKGTFPITEKPNTKYMECESEEDTLWKTELDDSVDVTQCGIEYFKDMLQKYQKSIKMLSIERLSNDINFSEFESFPRLEELKVNSDYDIEKLIHKVRRPLKNLEVDGEKNCQFLRNWEQLYQVTNTIDADCLELNEDQFSRLSALNVSIAIGQISEMYIFNIIRSWQNGTWKPMECYTWDLYQSSFDAQKLLRFLEIGEDEIMQDIIPNVIIKHNKEPERFAKLFFNRAEVRFHIWN